jgi:hypothetical protein
LIKAKLMRRLSTSPRSVPHVELYNSAVKNYAGGPNVGFEMLLFGHALDPDAPAQSDLYNGRLKIILDIP